MLTRTLKPLFSKPPKTLIMSQNPTFSSQTLTPPPPNSNQIADYFTRNFEFPSEIAAKTSSIPNSVPLLTFFKSFGFSSSDLLTLVQTPSAPKLLSADLDYTIKPKFQTFLDFGFSNFDIVHFINHDPWLLLSCRKKRMWKSLFVLKSLLGSVELVGELLRVSSWFNKCDLEKTLVPNVEFFRSCGIGLEELRRSVFVYPRVFLLRPESLGKFVEVVDGMGVDRGSDLYLYAITCVSSIGVEAWGEKLEVFRSLGFTEDQICQMFQKAPRSFMVSKGKIEEVMELISGSEMYGLSDVVVQPCVFSCSLERRLKPRLEVLEILRSKYLIPSYPGFSLLCMVSDRSFIEFVSPFVDVLGDTYFVKRQLLEKGCSGKPV